MLTIHQYFNIHTIRVDNITNSSVLQIGTSGQITATSLVNENTANKTQDGASPILYEPYLAPLPNPT